MLVVPTSWGRIRCSYSPPTSTPQVLVVAGGEDSLLQYLASTELYSYGGSQEGWREVTQLDYYSCLYL